MRHVTILALTAPLALAAALVGVVPFVEAGKPLQEMPLVLSFATTVDGADPGIWGDDGGAYIDGIDNVRAFLYPTGSPRFTTLANTSIPGPRRVCFGPGNSTPPFPLPNCWPLHQIESAIFNNYANNVNIRTLMPGDDPELRLIRFDWKDGTNAYSLGYGTNMDQTDFPDVPDSPGVHIECIAAPSGTCTTWTVASQYPHAAALFVARQVLGKNGKPTVGAKEYVGHFAMPFFETLTVK